MGDPDRIATYVFDILHLDGEDLTKRPLTDRKETLHAPLGKTKPMDSLRYCDHIASEGTRMFE